MPRGDPFTQFCQQMAGTGRAPVADLHLHSTCSDGDFTPSHVVALASVAKLKAMALTDHDTLAGIAVARDSALQFPEARRPEIIAGVEVSAEFEGREIHVLGLLVDAENAELNSALARISESRVVRFHAFVEYFRHRGTPLDEGRVQATLAGTVCPGRRHVAGLLVDSGIARSRFEAFQRHLGPALHSIPPKALIPAEVAIHLIHQAGGIASFAHPPSDCDAAMLHKLHLLGLRAVEVEFPASTVSRTLELRTWAKVLGWAITGGSDSHGADRPLGSRGVTAPELAELRGRSGWASRRPWFDSKSLSS